MRAPVRVSRIRSKAELCLMEQVPDSCAIVIFGVSGDLAFRKLIPSLFYLDQSSLLPKNYYIIGAARSAFSNQELKQRVRDAVGRASETEIHRFLERWSYIRGDYTRPETYEDLKGLLSALDKKFGVGERRIFYLATPPEIYPVIIERIGSSGLSAPSKGGRGWVRVVVEKPFGKDLASAESLNKTIHRVLREDQVYRIDHYLGKETVQNIMMFRFANALFEPAWNRNFIDHVQITAAEALGVEDRAGYYEQSGVLRDMFQNHLLQILALVAMEPPVRFEASAVHDRKADIFKAIRPFSEEGLERNAVFAQYSAAELAGQRVKGYREESGVDPLSNTPTFASMRLEIDNWRWQGVPFYLRSGKRLARRVTEISIVFKRVPVSMFQPLSADDLAPNTLRFRIQPDECVSLNFEAKHPGPKLCISTVTMDFDYRATFKTTPPESYARLLLDAMTGDQTLFTRSDGVEQCWRILEPLLKRPISRKKERLLFYPAGSWGPKEDAALLTREGRAWDLSRDYGGAAAAGKTHPK